MGDIFNRLHLMRLLIGGYWEQSHLSSIKALADLAGLMQPRTLWRESTKSKQAHSKSSHRSSSWIALARHSGATLDVAVVS